MLTELGQQIFADRYALFPGETYEQAADRVASIIPDLYWRSAIAEGIKRQLIVPAGRIWRSVGTENLTGYNCYVLPSPHDSRGGIVDTLRDMIEIMSHGGGVGINLATLRPTGNKVYGVSGKSSGPVSWGEIYSFATGLIEQGGCFAPDTLISTHLGLIKAKELVEMLEEGQHVSASTQGIPEKITAYFRNGKKKVIKFTTERGYTVTVTPNHKMGVMEGETVVLKEAKHISPGETLTLLIGKGYPYSSLVTLKNSGYTLPKMSTTLNENVTLPEHLEEELAYILGFMYGNGYVVQGKKKNWKAPKGISLAVSNKYPEVLDRLAEYITNVFCIYPSYQEADGDATNIVIYSRIIIEWLKENGLLKQKAKDIRIPEQIFKSPAYTQAAFIAGYFDADGCDRNSKGGFSFDSISKGMLEDLQILLLHNGIVSRLHEQERKNKKWQTIYRLNVTGKLFKDRFYNLIPASKLPNELPYMRNMGKSFALHGRILEETVVKIEDAGTVETYDFEVEHEHMLSANGFYTSNSRRGALMLTLPIWHPSILEFITIKKTPGRMENANLSVLVSDHFMRAVREDESWTFIFPDTTDPLYESTWDGDIYAYKGRIMAHGGISARELWNTIAESAWQSAEPGVIFWDTVRETFSGGWDGEKPVCVNPCSEQPLPAYGVCNLAHVNLAECVDENGEFDWYLFSDVVEATVVLLDTIIDHTSAVLPEVEEQQAKERRIGVGVLGLHDALIKMGIVYGSEASLEFVREVMKVLYIEAAYSSSNLAEV